MHNSVRRLTIFRPLSCSGESLQARNNFLSVFGCEKRNILITMWKIMRRSRWTEVVLGALLMAFEEASVVTKRSPIDQQRNIKA